MKAAIATTAAMLMAGVLAAPVYSATGDSGQTYGEPASGAQAPAAQSPAATGAPASESMMPGKNAATCARLDKNSDGYITWPEFKASGQSDKVFKSADAERRGKLSMEECSKALSG